MSENLHLPGGFPQAIAALVFESESKTVVYDDGATVYGYSNRCRRIFAIAPQAHLGGWSRRLQPVPAGRTGALAGTTWVSASNVDLLYATVAIFKSAYGFDYTASQSTVMQSGGLESYGAISNRKGEAGSPAAL